MSTQPAQAPRLSVIVAAWNAAATLPAAIGSVLDQADADLECVVVDDGSTDDTAAVLERLADPRLVVDRLAQNGGVSAARNRALELARGEWVAFLDADDRLLPGGLAAMLRAGDATDALAVVGQRISNDGERTWYPKLYDFPDIREAGRKSLVTHPDLLYYVGPVGKLFRRAAWEGLRFEGRMVGDQPWVVQALVRAGDRIEVVEDVVYEWRRPRPGNEFTTITAARERSAKLGAEAVRMAGVAWHVASRAFRAAWDADTAARMEALYLRRILRADLAAQLHRATERGDPDLATLIEALERLLLDVPAAAVRGAQDAVRVEVLDSLNRARLGLATPARRAAFRLAATAASIDRGTLRSATGRARRWPVRIAATLPVVGRPLGLALSELWFPVERRRTPPPAPTAPPSAAT